MKTVIYLSITILLASCSSLRYSTSGKLKKVRVAVTEEKKDEKLSPAARETLEVRVIERVAVNNEMQDSVAELTVKESTAGKEKEVEAFGAEHEASERNDGPQSRVWQAVPRSYASKASAGMQRIKTKRNDSSYDDPRRGVRSFLSYLMYAAILALIILAFVYFPVVAGVIAVIAAAVLVAYILVRFMIVWFFIWLIVELLG